MSRLRSAKRVIAPVAVVAALAAAPASAHEAGGGPGEPAPFPAPQADGEPAGRSAAAAEARPSQLRLRLRGLRGGKLDVGGRFTAAGTLRPFANGQRVTLYLRRGKKTIRRKTMYVRRQRGKNLGKFRLRDKLLRPGRYTVQAVHEASGRLGASKDRTQAFRIRYPDLDPGNRNSKVKLFNRLLARRGYVNDRGRAYDAATQRAVLAFRKVNGMSRTTNASAKNFKKLAKGKGGYKLRYPASGRHVEADLSRQVMVLAKGPKVKEIYHVSTGAPATPTIPGTWRFYRKEPGFNNKGMYYSVYYNRGYAIHGYKSVPTYPASHGCLRNPIPNSKHIYNWVEVGMPIHIYR